MTDTDKADIRLRILKIVLENRGIDSNGQLRPKISILEECKSIEEEFVNNGR